MALISRTFEIGDLTPQEMASTFAGWNGDDQAKFFAAVAAEADKWPYGRSSFCMQALHIAKALDADGRYIIERIAVHAGLIPEQVSA